MTQPLVIDFIGNDTTDKAFDQILASNAALESQVGRLTNVTDVNSASMRTNAMAVGVAGQAYRLNSFQMQNMAYQMNDMATMLASGQSPFVMMMQQGMQMSQIFGSNVGPRAALRATGRALTSFITNPLNLTVLGFAAAAGAVSLFIKRLSSADDTGADALKDHVDLVRDLADAYGEATVKVNEYSADTREVLRFRAEQSQAGLVAEVETQAKKAVIAMRNALRFGSFGDNLDPISAIVDRFAIAAKAGAPDIATLRRELLALSNVEPRLAAPIEAMLDATQKLAEVQAAISTGASVLSPYGGPLPNALDPEDRRSAQDRIDEQFAATRRKAAEEAAREAEAVRDLIRELEFEKSLIGLTNVEKEVSNQLRSAGSAATAQQRAEIEMLVRETELLRQAEEREKEAREAAEDRADYFRSIGEQGLSTLISQVVRAENAWQRLTLQIAEAALQAALFGSGPLASGGGGGGGLLSNLASAIFGGGGGGFLSNLLPGRAGGGPGSAGQAYRTHFQDGEVFIPSTGGKFVPGGGRNIINIMAPAGTGVKSQETRTIGGAEVTDIVLAAQQELAGRGDLDSVQAAYGGRRRAIVQG